MNILVTGAKGRLGRRLHSLLCEEGYNVYAPCRKDCDWSSEGSVKEYLEGKQVDAVFGLASYTNVPGAEKEQSACYRDTVETADRVARYCQNTGTRNIYISSDYVIPLLRGERSGVYAMCKLEAEKRTTACGGHVVRLAFVTPEQVHWWSFVNAYTLSNRWWVEKAALALVRYLKLPVEDVPKIANIGPTSPTTPYEMLLERDPSHPALKRVVRSPQEMRALIGYCSPADTRFPDIFEV